MSDSACRLGDPRPIMGVRCWSCWSSLCCLQSEGVLRDILDRIQSWSTSAGIGELSCAIYNPHRNNGTDGLTDPINSFGYIDQSQPETETCARELWGRAIIGYQYITIYYTMRRAQSNFWLFLVRRDEPLLLSSSCLGQTTKTTADIAGPLPSFIFNKHGNGNMQSSQTDNKGQQTFLAAWTARSRPSPSLTKSPSRSMLVAGEKA